MEKKETYTSVDHMMEMAPFGDSEVGNFVKYKGKKYKITDVKSKNVIDSDTYSVVITLNPLLFVVGIVDRNGSYFVEVFSNRKRIYTHLKRAIGEVANFDI